MRWYLRVGLTLLAITVLAQHVQATSPNPSQRVDQLLAEEVFIGVSPGDLAPVVDDTAFLRRASLDLVGALPSPEALMLFILDPAKDKRAKAIDRLLADSRFGTNWARYWRDVILYRRSEDRALIVSQPLEAFLTEQLNENVGWDKVAKAFVEATGNISENGATGLIMAQMGEPNDVAAEVSRIFMGIQIQCAQCHNHPTDHWKREQFHEFAAFFPRVSLRPVLVDGKPRGFEVASRDNGFRPRMGNGQPGRGSLEHYMPDLKDPTSQGKLMTPVFFATGQSVKTGTKDLDRRDSIGDWMTATNNPWFAKAFVNRIWAELVGEGFYEPIDDMGPDRKATAPKTLDYLAGEFAARNYDVKWLYETIMNTTAYQREARPRRNEDQLPFTANTTQPLRADVIFDVLASSLGINLDQFGGRLGKAAYPGVRFGIRFLFDQVFGYDPSIRRHEVAATIPQALILMNSGPLNQAVSGKNRSTRLGKMLNSDKDDRELVDLLYLRCLAREPNKDELRLCLAHVRKTKDRTEAFEDILWSLINSSEFVHRN
ncbi:MAG: DUF1549 and DUF1553 domain-containing protein [Planctomycetes bacterium]|nr:DUF1549 and DUF1553 domain-containing protein [Planctomycetota bacterium]